MKNVTRQMAAERARLLMENQGWDLINQDTSSDQVKITFQLSDEEIKRLEEQEG